ncbi:MAG TPA: ATP-binding protein [Candidatus Chromulinivoraceae bacterium]|nr:ATP-binding protein [Candidatus Chromulinivoraceae bacterium]
MDLADFERLVEGSEESQSLDFKGPCSWDVKSLAKDILAFSNVQDGGYIVIGFDDKTFKRVGISEKQEETFSQETMQDQMTKFADPFVTFTVHKIIDNKGLRFVVIRIMEFPEVPVVCKADSADTHQGKVYYRSRRRRPESEAVSNSFDMRDILDRAAVKMMTKRKSQGYTAETAELKNYYDEELGGL